MVDKNWNINSAEWLSRKAYIDFTDEDAHLLKQMYPTIAKHADRIVDGFYDNVQRQTELTRLIENAGSSMDRLKAAQKRYLLELFSGNYDENYCQQRLRIGQVHNTIGLTPRWYLGAYSVYNQLIMPLIRKKYFFSPSSAAATQIALNKILSLDSQLAIDSYIFAMMDDMKSITMSKDEIEHKVTNYRTAIEYVANGDLTVQVEVDEQGHDDLTILGKYINEMINKLQSTSSRIHDATNTMQVTLSEVQSAANVQSTAASEQAASVNQTTTTLEQIRVTSNQTLDKAQALGLSAEKTRQKGEDGLKIVEQVVEAMETIKEKVEGIAHTILALSQQTQQAGEITGVVSGLAQQSKMLALNASIEAVKAGEAGKGFGVVAAEVRSLAEQSHQATTQVQKILMNIREATDRSVMVTEEGSKQVDAGASLVSHTGESIRELSRVIQETATASQQIVAAVRQGKAGIDQIAIAMDEINKVTRQFVTSTQQTSTAAEDLGQVAESLLESVSVYKV